MLVRRVGFYVFHPQHSVKSVKDGEKNKWNKKSKVIHIYDVNEYEYFIIYICNELQMIK